MDALLLTRQEAAALLCISVRALDRLKAEERIPARRRASRPA